MFSEILKELRIEKELTHSDLAKSIGYSRAIIGHWENGIREPTSNAIVALAAFFNVSTDYLLGLNNNYASTITTNVNTNTRMRLQSIHDQLSPLGRETLIEFAEATLANELKNYSNTSNAKNKII